MRNMDKVLGANASNNGFLKSQNQPKLYSY